MKDDRKSAVVLTALTFLFLGLAAAFVFDLWGNPQPLPRLPETDPVFTNTATVRLSASELIRTGGDTSGMDCYACHEKGKTPQLHFDANQKLVLPKEHEDLVLRHGRNDRNENCFNCHDSENLDLLKLRDGRKLKITESTQLCGSCHGPTYRDWEAGIHGRTSGYWNRKLGSIQRQDCVSCHDPHSPAFPSMKPGPGPHALHPQTGKVKER